VLDNLTSGDAAVERYLQKVAGYCLYGVQLEKAAFIVVGEHDSGKSTMFVAFRKIMGDYALSARIELFLEDPRNFGNGSTNDLAELMGFRLVVAGEPDHSAALSSAKLKVLVGIDETRLRLNYQQGRSGPTTYNVVIHCNEIPRLGRGGDAALRSRLRILPGGKTIPEAARDGHLATALEEEYPAILRWMIDGAVMVNQEGLGKLPGAAVDCATNISAGRTRSPIGWRHTHTAEIGRSSPPRRKPMRVSRPSRRRRR
jgi:putative DNA primase/helicase